MLGGSFNVLTSQSISNLRPEFSRLVVGLLLYRPYPLTNCLEVIGVQDFGLTLK